MRGKDLCVHGEDAKRYKSVNISEINNINFKKFLDSYLLYGFLQAFFISKETPAAERR